MSARVVRRQVLLSTAALVGALSGYSRSAYAICDTTNQPIVVCSGPQLTTPQTFNYNNAAVSTVTGFGGVDTTLGGGGDAISINGAGALSYTDEYGAPLISDGTALFIRSTGDFGGGGSVTVNTNGALTGTNRGIDARNYGSGVLDIATGGDVTGTSNSSDGIYAANRSGTDLNVTIAADTLVEGGRFGVGAYNFGSGATDITVNGDITGTGANGINVRHFAGTGDLNVTTAAGTHVSGGDDGIFSGNYGNGATIIIANGDITGMDRDGITARHAAGGPIHITVGPESAVTSNGAGIGDFAIRTREGPADVTVAGTLNGGGGGAVQFDQLNDLDDRLALETSAVINGNVFAGPGTDTLAFGGNGNGAFDLGDIDTGTNTAKFQDFEVFEVESGTWNFTGGTTVPFSVTGGTLEGTGTFGGLTVTGGTIAPGNSIGTMIVNGNFRLGRGAVFEVETNAAGQSDKVIVRGTVNLTGSTLRVLAENGNYKDSTNYTIIKNDGNDAVRGRFSRVTSSLAFLTPTVNYAGGDGNDVVLNLARNMTLFPDVAQTKNQRAVANALSMFPAGNALFLAVLNQTATGARQAFDALSGEVHGTVAGTLANNSRYTREAVLGRLKQASHTGDALSAGGPQVASYQVANYDAQAYALGYDGKSLIEEAAPERAPLAFWTRAFGAWGDFDSDGNAASADRDLGGFISGMDAHVGGTWRVGLATGASFSNVDVSDRFSSADVETYHLGGYAGGMAGPFALRGGGLWAWNDVDTSRAVIFPGFFERQTANYDADTGQLFGEIAYPTQMGGIQLEPFGGLAFVSIDTDSFRERGGPLTSLRGVDVDQDVGYTTLGLRAANTMMWGAMEVTPHISAAWLHAFDDVTPGAALAFASTGIGFAVDGVPLAEDSGLLNAGLDFALSDRMTAGVSYTGQYSSNVTDNGVKGRFTWLFN